MYMYLTIIRFFGFCKIYDCFNKYYIKLSSNILWYICLMVLRCLLATSYAQVTTLMLFEQEYMQPTGLLAGILGVFLPFSSTWSA